MIPSSISLGLYNFTVVNLSVSISCPSLDLSPEHVSLFYVLNFYLYLWCMVMGVVDLLLSEKTN